MVAQKQDGNKSTDLCERCGKNPKVKVKPHMIVQNYRYCKECRSEIAKQNVGKRYG